MTLELKDLMDRESDRADNYFTPDPAMILAAGRRRRRNRRLGIGATLVTACAVLTAGVGLIVQEHREDAPVAGGSGRPQDAYNECDTSSGTRLGKNSWTWPEVKTLTDEYGSASLRRDPDDPNQVVYCVTQPKAPTGDLPLGQSKGIIVRKTPVNERLSVTTVFGRTYAERGGTVMVALGDSADTPFPGHLTPDYTVVAKLGEATVVETYFIYRQTENSAWPGPRPKVAVASYQMKGWLYNQGKW
ncbi:hypothetical protein OG474_08400 [Kribbella sp. NBC_01505]|uniref:hypothetical protein n=1 Tax=Kribbella sp. NBC_01505 TaxID=2903580 RepID=UPI00386C16C9